MAFTLYIVRHSKAQTMHPDGDRWRELSPEGFQRIDDLLPRIELRGFTPELYLTSPYRRAQQTCGAFRARFDPRSQARLETSGDLVPDGDVDGLLAELGSWVGAGLTSCAVFSHNPFVTILAETLVRRAPDSGFHFHTPTVTVLSFSRIPEKHQGDFLWTEHRED